MLRAVIFDIDGTLLDSVDLHATAWQQAFSHYGHDIPFPDIREQIGKGGDQLMPAFLSREELGRIGEELEKHRGDLFKREFLPQVKPFPQVRELFEDLRAQGKKLALASSAKKEELDKYKDILNIADLVEEDVSSDDAERSKPHPDIFEAALEKLRDIPPRDAIAVGDTPWDAEAAGKAGIWVVGVLCGGCEKAKLLEAGCIAVYQDPADLLVNWGSQNVRPAQGRPQ